MRGVAIPELREQLFAATERVMARDGAAGVTSRAITDEAGCAKGVLHNHFDGLDGFLAEFAMDRARRSMALVAGLAALAGQDTVSGNLTSAALAVFGSGVTVAASLVLARPVVMLRMSAVFQAGGPLGEVETTFAGYLRAEQSLGRVAAGTDPDTLAFSLVGTIHHLLITQLGRQLDPGQVAKIVTTLLGPSRPLS
jgi:AcrR family transcriptional regulator